MHLYPKTEHLTPIIQNGMTYMKKSCYVNSDFKICNSNMISYNLIMHKQDGYFWKHFHPKSCHLTTLVD